MSLNLRKDLYGVTMLRDSFCILLGRLTFLNFKAILSLIEVSLDNTS